MSREKDEGKRQAILAAGKRLFAERGFHGVSVSDLAKEIDLPVGSIYTYFENKESIARTVIEEGWEAFFAELSTAFKAQADPEEKIAALIDRFLPLIFQDVDFIALMLNEGWLGSGLLEKLESLAELIGRAVSELSGKRGQRLDLPPRQAMAALCIFFLGSLDTIRLAASAGLPVKQKDILAFIRLAIETSFGIELG
jgi:AcrR family transcriptional regulator